MARIMAANTDSGIESDPEEQSVLLVVDIGDSVITSRDDTNCSAVVSVVDELSSADVSHDSDLSSQPMDVSTTPDDTHSDDTTSDTTPLTTPLETTPDDERQSFRLSLSSGEVLTVSLDTFSEYEARALPEFFSGSARGKSPESYVRIRNHFIAHWRRVRPKRFSYHQMLRKVSHLHLGNVTAFSRVQKFLEACKVINEGGVSQRQLQRIRRRERTTATNDDAGDAPNDAVKLSSSRTRPNPFKLVPLETYDQQSPPPFVVRLSMEALAVIDVHAHCVRTEVIGLLGGRFCEKTRELRVLTCEPCASLDDHDLQCDMEPVSQARATEALGGRGLHVVGWYHSHPTFVPQPSVRDLETQLQFQRLFGRPPAPRPFLALILSPYCWTSGAPGARAPLHSRFACLHVHESAPFELPVKMIRTDQLFVALARKLELLVAHVLEHPSRVRLKDKLRRFRLKDNAPLTHAQKLMFSLEHFVRATGLSTWETARLLHVVEERVRRLY